MSYFHLIPTYRKQFIKHQRKLLFLCFSVLVFCTVLHVQQLWPIFKIKIYYWAHPEKDIACYAVEGKQSLPDISDFHPPKGNSIFFHETSCNSYLNEKIVINARQACAVESAARMNPHRKVYLLFASPGAFKNENTESDRILKVLMSYPNVNILHVDLKRYISGTPLESLWTSGKMRYSQYSQSHTSDVLRYLTLWKYQGIYLDLDVIVIKPLDDLGTNYAGFESKNDVAAGILSFDETSPGLEFVDMAVQDLKMNFRGDDWGWNGPGTITRLLHNLCSAGSVKNGTVKKCQGFTVYPEAEFYAVPWGNWEWFCTSKDLDKVINMTKHSHIIHVWNKFSSSCKIPLGTNISYLYFAKQFCPKVINELDEFF